MRFRSERFYQDLAERRFLMLAAAPLYIIFGTVLVLGAGRGFSELNSYLIVSALMLGNAGLSFLPGFGEQKTEILFSLNTALVVTHAYGIMYLTQLDPVFTIGGAVLTYAVMDALIFVSIARATGIYSLTFGLILGTVFIDSSFASSINPHVFTIAVSQDSKVLL